MIVFQNIVYSSRLTLFDTSGIVFINTLEISTIKKIIMLYNTGVKVTD